METAARYFKARGRLSQVGTIEPVHVLLPTAQPGELSLGQLARGDYATLLHLYSI